MNAFNYPVFLVYSEEDAAWLARVDVLPGCMADGATPEEALQNAKLAIESWIETSKELSRPIPAPLSLEKIEELQAKLAQKQQEMIHAVIQQAIEDAIRQVQSPKHQVLGGIVHNYGTGREIFSGFAETFSVAKA